MTHNFKLNKEYRLQEILIWDWVILELQLTRYQMANVILIKKKAGKTFYLKVSQIQHYLQKGFTKFYWRKNERL